jgi:RND family efflux transporter MFP subunit
MNREALVAQLRIARDAPASVPKRSVRPLLIAAVLLLVAVAVATGAVLLLRPTLVAVAPAMAAQAPASGAQLQASGYVVARRAATVSSKITGRVVDVLIEEGQHVRAGDIIARLDASNADAALAQARAQARTAGARQNVAEVVLRDAEAKYRRSLRLNEQGFLSDAAAETALTTRDSARETLELARREVGAAEAAAETYRRAADDTIVRAPFSGVVTVKAAQAGEIVSPVSAGGGFTRTGIGSIVDMDSLEVQVDVGENFISRITQGMPATVSLDAYPDWSIPAEVIAVIPTADRAKATVSVRVGLKIRDPRIVPEMAAHVAFLSAPAGAVRPGHAVLVPLAAIRSEPGGAAFVFVVEDGVARRRPVGLGPRRGAHQQIESGIVPGDMTVLGQRQLRDGSRVRTSIADGPRA